MQCIFVRQKIPVITLITINQSDYNFGYLLQNTHLYSLLINSKFVKVTYIKIVTCFVLT
jgi:hypothetical protein